MASSTQKKTNTSTAKKGSSGSSSRSGGSRSASSGRSSSGRSRAPAPKPIRREVGALVCLLLAILSALGCFGVDAIVINWLSDWTKGLIGYGFWLMPVALLGCAVILGFHRGRPVQARVWCTLLIPVMVGALLHLFLAKGTYPWEMMTLVKTLWAEGKAMTAGGVLSGILAQALIAAVSKIGAAIFFLLALAGLGMGCARVTPADMFSYFKDRPRTEYEYEEEEEPQPTGARSAAPRHPVTAPAKPPRRKSAIDIPLDDDEETPAPQPEEAPTKKKGFFDAKPRVPAPDQLLTGADSQPPEQEEPVKAPARPPVAPPEPFPMPKEDILARAAARRQSPSPYLPCLRSSGSPPWTS